MRFGNRPLSARALVATDAATIQALAEEASGRTGSLSRAKTPQAVRRVSVELASSSSNLQVAVQAIEQAHGDAEKIRKEAQAAAGKITELKTSAETEAARTAAEKAAAEQKAAQEAAARKKEEEHKALMAQETEKSRRPAKPTRR